MSRSLGCARAAAGAAAGVVGSAGVARLGGSRFSFVKSGIWGIPGILGKLNCAEAV